MSGVTTVYIGKHFEWTTFGGVCQTPAPARWSSTTTPAANAWRCAKGPPTLPTSSATKAFADESWGSTSITANSNGTLSSEQRYRPWGATRYSNGATPTSFQYTGQRNDAGIGLYFYGARYYAPYLNRFLSPDLIIPDMTNPQGLNRYSYTLNNPLKYVDPSGYMFQRALILGEPSGKSPFTLPSTRYYYSKEYGWFDSSHLGTGNPRQIIKDVKQAIADGGDVVPIRQNIQAGPIKLVYEGRYQISEEARPEDAIGIAYSIYRDWSHRFEAWEGTMAFGRGKGTSFAVEDLPSHHIGFFVEVYPGFSAPYVFAALGGVEGTSEEPPRHIKNHTFEPIVQNAEGQYERALWPSWMTIIPVDSNTNTWTFVDGGCVEGYCFLSGE